MFQRLILLSLHLNVSPKTAFSTMWTNTLGFPKPHKLWRRSPTYVFGERVNLTIANQLCTRGRALKFDSRYKGFALV